MNLLLIQKAFLIQMGDMQNLSLLKVKEYVSQVITLLSQQLNKRDGLVAEIF